MSVRRATLADICTVVGGGTPTRSTAEYYGGRIPWVTPKDMKTWEIRDAQVRITEAGLENSATRLVPPNSVLVVVRSGVLKHTVPVAINRVSVAINQDMKALLCAESADPNYVARFIKARVPVILQWVRATTADNFPVDKLKGLEIPLPPLAEQQRIAKILDRADALQADRHAALVQLDTLIQSIFLHMFGDPATNQKGWPVKRLEEVCELVNGRAFKPAEWEESGLPIIRIQNLNDSKKPFNYTTKALSERFRVRSGDILFSWSGTPGTSFGCFRWRGPEGWLNQHIFNVRLNDSMDGAFFISHVNLKLGELIAKAHGGVGLQHVTKGMVDETRLMVPPRDLQRDFAAMTVNVDRIREKLITSETTLHRLFTCLQNEAFRGGLVKTKRGPDTLGMVPLTS